jgi:hypothetical protein
MMLDRKSRILLNHGLPSIANNQFSMPKACLLTLSPLIFCIGVFSAPLPPRLRVIHPPELWTTPLIS